MVSMPLSHENKTIKKAKNDSYFNPKRQDTTTYASFVEAALGVTEGGEGRRSVSPHEYVP